MPFGFDLPTVAGLTSSIPIIAWVVAAVFISILGIGGIVYWQWRKKMFASYDILCPIFEPTQSGLALRSLDWGRRFQSPEGEKWEFWTERPPVEVVPPESSHVLGWSDKLYIRTARLFGHDLPSGAKFAVEETRPNRVVWGKRTFGICQFLLVNNQYIPFSYDLTNLADGRIRILKVPDVKVWLDEQRKLQLRHLMRTDKLLQYLPLILSAVLVIVILIALAIFAWMHHKDTQLLTEVAAVSRESLGTAKALVTQQVNATLA